MTILILKWRKTNKFGTPYPENYSKRASEFIEELDDANCE
jgi:hypothetical protein